MAKLISKTYGDALFELAIEEAQVDVLQEEIEAMLVILKQEEEFDRLMKHPQIPREEKLQLIQNVFADRVCVSLMGFLHTVVKADRYPMLQEILEYFLEEVKKYKGIGTVKVSTPMALKEEQRKRLIARLLETTEFRKIELIEQVDETLIGGMVIRIGDRVVDNSVKSRLETLQRQLLQVQV